MNENCVISIKNLTKEYKLGVIGSGTLRNDLQSFYARRRGKQDPNLRIGTKQYEKDEKFLALNNINLEVHRGERLGIIGANGAGKSTLLKILSRVTSPTNGNVKFRGRIASMLEVGTGFHPELTGRENIFLNGAILGMNKAEVASKIDEIIEFSECEKFIDTPVKRYSSGMFVKLAFSVASHLDAEIMIMDEVLAVGDAKFQKKCIDKMRELAKNENRTILYVSHNMETIRNLCSRSVVLEHGEKIFDGDVDEGIKLYLGGEQENFCSANYSDDSKRECTNTHNVKIMSANYYGKTDNKFYDDEKLPLCIKWKNTNYVNNLCLRVELFDFHRYPITAFVIEDFYSGNAGSIVEKKFLLDINQIAKGGYYTKYVLYNQQQNNLVFETLDCVKGLTIRKYKSNLNKIGWKKKWGSVEMPPINIVD